MSANIPSGNLSEREVQIDKLFHVAKSMVDSHVEYRKAVEAGEQPEVDQLQSYVRFLDTYAGSRYDIRRMHGDDELIYDVECAREVQGDGKVMIVRKAGYCEPEKPEDWLVAVMDLMTGEMEERDVILASVTSDKEGDKIALELAPSMMSLELPTSASDTYNRGNTLLDFQVSNMYYTSDVSVRTRQFSSGYSSGSGYVEFPPFDITPRLLDAQIDLVCEERGVTYKQDEKKDEIDEAYEELCRRQLGIAAVKGKESVAA